MIEESHYCTVIKDFVFSNLVQSDRVHQVVAVCLCKDLVTELVCWVESTFPVHISEAESAGVCPSEESLNILDSVIT